MTENKGRNGVDVDKDKSTVVEMVHQKKKKERFRRKNLGINLEDKALGQN